MTYQTQFNQLKDEIVALDIKRRYMTMLALFEALLDYRDKAIMKDDSLEYLQIKKPMFGEMGVSLHYKEERLGTKTPNVIDLCMITFNEIRQSANWGSEQKIVITPSDNILTLVERYITPEYQALATKFVLETEINPVTSDGDNTQKAKNWKI